jgi:glycosyltransferase involved in cell wall biosynthesis
VTTPLPQPARVTVIIAARNEARRISECLTSLLAQTYAPLEIIVVDDGSSDTTADIAARFAGVRVLRRAHSGKARAIAAAADVAGGDILCFLDGDMVFAPDYIATLVAPIVSGAEVGTSHGTELVANPDNRWSRCWQQRAGLPPDVRVRLTPRQVEAGSIVFRAVRADAFRRVGGFDDVGYMDDQTLSPKLERRARWVVEARCRHYNVESLGEVVALGRWGAHSILHRHGAKAVRSFLPPLIPLHAVRDAVRHGNPAMFVYTAAYEWGVFVGLLARLRTRRSGARTAAQSAAP